MFHSLKRRVALFTALLIIGCLAVPAAGVAGKPAGQTASAASTVTTSKVDTCAEATRVANFALRRVKKITKRWRNGQVPLSKVKNARRIWKSWLREKNRLCSGGGSGGSQTPLALSETEVRARVNSQASQYCSIDPYCYDYGVWTSGGSLSCESKSTYTWSCREVVSRSGYNGLTSYRDTSYGWNCS
jgi:hypothetical protein